ncbi:MAG TPA: imidazoleglycerol-phosphate dehydratase HisB [Candidatus Sulfotelmatobacter sp.]|nr:imidazoleglycerol-phosphate dehydratase HisB [Candidatus Sulfotelmatobacter sp.]
MRRARRARLGRKTAETDIRIGLTLDGQGRHSISTGIPFLDHMLSQVARHGLFDLTLKASGDLEVDDHHTAEDVGISLGEAFVKALGDKRGIRRYGEATVPMDEALARVAIDLSGRPYLVFQAGRLKGRIGTFAAELVKEFLKGFTTHLKANVHVTLLYGENKHHMAEAIFKALARALDDATSVDPRVHGVPSTKGKL